MRKVNHVLLEEITKSLPQLNKLLKKDIGYNVKLFVNIICDRNNVAHFEINSKPFDPKDFGIFKTGIRQAHINSFGSLGIDEDGLWFRPHLSYIHYDYGTNGFEMHDGIGKKLLYVYHFKTKTWTKFC